MYFKYRTDYQISADKLIIIKQTPAKSELYKAKIAEIDQLR